MKRSVEIRKKKVVYQRGPFSVEEAHVQHTLHDGRRSSEFVRVSFDRGDSVAAIVHEPVADTIVLTEQFRYPSSKQGNGWILELRAGRIEVTHDQSPEMAMLRELLEETGYRANRVQHLYTFYVSPGGTSERVHLFYIRIAESDRIDAGGGQVGSHEDISVITMPVFEAIAKLEVGEILDAKTIIGLQWLKFHRRMGHQEGQNPNEFA